MSMTMACNRLYHYDITGIEYRGLYNCKTRSDKALTVILCRCMSMQTHTARFDSLSDVRCAFSMTS